MSSKLVQVPSLRHHQCVNTVVELAEEMKQREYHEVVAVLMDADGGLELFSTVDKDDVPRMVGHLQMMIHDLCEGCYDAGED